MQYAIRCKNGTRFPQPSAHHYLCCSAPVLRGRGGEACHEPFGSQSRPRSVEDRLGTPLFARTTRSVSLTEVGTQFAAGVEPALVDIGKAIEGLSAERGQVIGLLRINAPRGVLDTLPISILARLATRD
jgi:hypothetical protein